MRCDSMLNGCRDRGIGGEAESLNGSAEKLYRFRRSHRVLLYKSSRGMIKCIQSFPRFESPLGFRDGFIALSPSLHL